jgi:two-component system response regulator MprA
MERRAPANGQTRGELRFGDLVIDRDAITCFRGAREIQLSRTEYLLLELLMANQGKVLSRDLIFDKVWGYNFGPESNSLDVYVGYLRRKLEAAGEPRIIHTVRGVGYVMRDP